MNKRQDGFSVIEIVAAVCVLTLVVVVGWLFLSKQYGTTDKGIGERQTQVDTSPVSESQSQASITFRPLKSAVGDVDTGEIGDYSVKGKTISMYLGHGSGRNSAKVTKVVRTSRGLKISVDANYCGETRDLHPLVVKIELDEAINTNKLVDVKISPICGDIPGRI